MEGLDYGGSDRESFGTPGVLVGMNRIPLRLRAVIAADRWDRRTELQLRVDNDARMAARSPRANIVVTTFVTSVEVFPNAR